MTGNVLIVGSLNMDLIVNTMHHPVIGETVLGGKFSTAPGGKGANQAISAARMGAKVTLIGRVGCDGFGEELRAAAIKDGIDTTYITIDELSATGIALITVDSEGRNTIVVASGANSNLTPDQLYREEDAFAAADVFVTQLENPLETINEAIKMAVKHNLVVILNPAPARPLSTELLSQVDYLIPNEIEAMQITGETSIASAIDKLLQMGVRNLIITLGEQGVLIATARGQEKLPAYHVKAVDTVAAGDAFVGTFASGLADNLSVVSAVRLGIAAAGISVTRPGAQPSLPTLTEVKEFINAQKA